MRESITTAPILRTDRLVLRPHRPDDLDALTAMAADPLVNRWVGGARPREETWIRLLRSIGQWTAFGYGAWIACDAATGAFVGEVGLIEARRAVDPPIDALPEVGWVLAASAHGRGFASEAMGAALGWAQAAGIARTTCIIDPDNARSLRLAGRFSYRPVREARYKGRPIVVLERG